MSNKDVRVRIQNDNLDIRVDLYEDGDTRRVSGSGPGRNYGTTIYKGSRYVDLTSDDLILDYLSILSKSGRISGNYEVVQDPWEEKPPIWRSYGFDPYYLNNGSKIIIKWFEGTLVSGGKEWSDENGNELDVKRGMSQSTKGFITKNVSIIPPSDSTDKSMIIKDSVISDDFETGQEFIGNTSDLSIITQVISYWKNKVPNYEIELCSPNNEFCNTIPYKSPIGEFVADETEPIPTEESTQTQGTPKIKLSIILPEDLNIKVKQDFNGLKVYIGEPPSDEGFIFQDDFDNLEELDPLYTEGSFAGDEELIMKEPDEEFRQEIDKAGDDVENNPVSGDSLPNSWFNYSTNKFGAPDDNKTYSSEYRSHIDSSKMPKPKMTKESLIAVKLKVEGGLTGNPNDSAAKKGFCPTPLGGKKYHTNKGITYVVWKSVFGKGNDQRFLKMNHNDWVAVFDKLYWNKHGNSSKYESVNALLVSYAWGGSKDATIKGAKKILGVSSLDVVAEAEAVAALMSARAQLFINISQPGTKNNVFRRGWINATNAFVAKMYVNALA